MCLLIENDLNISHKHIETSKNLNIKQSIDTIRKLICDKKDILNPENMSTKPWKPLIKVFL